MWALLAGIILVFCFSAKSGYSIDVREITELVNKCRKCHPAKYEEWDRSAHSISAQDSWVMAMYNGSNIKGLSLGPSYKGAFPKSQGDCASCHAPDIALRDPLNTNLNSVENSLGVSCLFCHFVERVDLHLDGSLPGVQSIKLKNLTQISNLPNECSIPKSSLVRKPIVCAPCHHGKYHDTLVFPSYEEWRQSRTGKTCQDCHFEKNAHSVTIDRDFLLQAVVLEFKSWIESEELFVKTAVTNTHAGHFFPTGHPLRNALLFVDVADENGAPLELTEGPTIPAYGYTVKKEYLSKSDYKSAGTGFARVLEKISPISCFNVSVPGPNALIGQSLALEQEYRALFPQEYWERTQVLEDTRLPPRDTRKHLFRFQLKPNTRIVKINVSLTYRKAFQPLASYYDWHLEDIKIKEISKHVSTKDGKEAPR